MIIDFSIQAAVENLSVIKKLNNSVRKQNNEEVF